MPERSTVLITGGNSGIGFQCARKLAGEGWHVVIASRNRETSQRAVLAIRQETNSDAVEEMHLDLGSALAVRSFAKEVEARELPIHALVCNAGLQFTRGPTLSPEGVELTIAVNHLGHFLLTNLLLRRLLAHAPSRVVVVSSGVHDPALRTGMPTPDIPDLETLAATGGAAPYNGRLAYVNSKLCNLWFSYELIRRIEAAGLSSDERPLSVNAFEPGLVPGSGLARDYPAPLRFLWDWVLPGLARFVPMMQTAEGSGGALAGVVLDPALERSSGKYFPSHTHFSEGRSSDLSYDVERGRALWAESSRLCGLANAETPLALD